MDTFTVELKLYTYNSAVLHLLPTEQGEMEHINQDTKIL